MLSTGVSREATEGLYARGWGHLAATPVGYPWRIGIMLTRRP